MAIGNQLAKADVDYQLTRIPQLLYGLLRDAESLKKWADAYSNSDIETKFGYASGEGVKVKSAIADLNNLRKVWEGAAYIPESGGPTDGAGYDFRASSREAFLFGF